MFFVNQETTACDVLVIGSGAAGLRAAIAAAENGCDVLLISKAKHLFHPCWFRKAESAAPPASAGMGHFSL